MQYYPSIEEFTELAGKATMVPVYRQLLSDSLTPVTAFCKIREGEWSYLFESVVGGERHGRHSFMGTKPFKTFEAYGNRVVVRQGAQAHEYHAEDPLRELEELLKDYRTVPVPGLKTFSGGAVGYIGYDSVRYVENLPHPPVDDRHLPDIAFGLYDQMVMFDHVDKTMTVVVYAQVNPNDVRQSYWEACSQVDQLVERLQRGVADLQITDIAIPGELKIPATSNFTAEQFQDAVRRCQEYILAGDIFQIVLSQRFAMKTNARSFDIYRALRSVNPSPYMFYLQVGPATLVGASPEIMTRVKEGYVITRPLAGTRRRGKTPAEDEALAKELLADEKERAEHIMLVDLGRNDVGRVSQYGTVELSELMTVERYSHVMHLSSTVVGQILPDKTAFDALRSCLPAGTLSGAPKVRAMEIIDELEPHRRGPYGGAVGYIDYHGNMDTCIALRTMVLQGQTAYIQAGAGIVADSDPASEYQETLNKAAGLMRALEIAETQL
ncbi:MAG: anthranilate synthase component I [Zavarzinella sp.]